MKSFFKTELNIKKQVIFTDGLIGGGKTLISNLVSGLKNVEQWVLEANFERICQYNALNKIDLDTSADFIKKIYNEKYFDQFILRHANFRKFDISSVLNHSRKKKILRRLNFTDNQAKNKIKNSKIILQYMTHSLAPFSEPIFRAFKKKLLYILILRNPFNIYTITWLSKWVRKFEKNNDRGGRVNFSYNKKKNFFFPFELYKNSNVKEYKAINSYEKAIFFMELYYLNCLKNLKKFSKRYQSSLVIIPFETLTLNPKKYLGKISKKINVKLDNVDLKNFKINKVPRKNSEKTFKMFQYDYRKNFDKKYLSKLNKDNPEGIKDLKYKFLKKKVSKKYLDKILNLEKFYIDQIYNEY